MNTFKSIISRLRRKKRRKLVFYLAIILGSLSLSVIILAAINYKQLSPRLAWRRLMKIDVLENCHEDCAVAKEKYRQEISSGYDYAQEDMLDCLFSQPCASASKKEAISLLMKDEDICESEIRPRLAGSNLDAASFLAIYQACQFELDPGSLRLALFFFNDSSGQTRKEMLRFLAVKAPASGMKAAAIEIVSGPGRSEAVSILAWLAGHGSFVSQKEASDIFSQAIIAKDENIIRRLVFLSADYFQKYPDICISFLETVASGNYGTAERFLAAETLRSHGLEAPIIPISENDLD